MKKEDFNQRINEIGQLEDAVEIREQLVQLSEEISGDFDRLADLETANQNLTSENEKLQSANMKLYLRVTKQKEPEKEKEKTGEPPVKRKFEDLFNEKGGLK